ncbi:hypothetical protein ATC00_19290 [Sinorhizobium americanum]|nr:hypothetical protein ATC00_19290 [Sinorhizobium americanum]
MVDFMASPTFVHLNLNWNAEPNAPDPEVCTSGSTIKLRFRLNSWKPGDSHRNFGFLTFKGCRKWRLGPTNDEGWFLGQCRYSKQAPGWGEFYELKGDDPLRNAPDDWQVAPCPSDGERHYLFYLREETFESFANEWAFSELSS